jgi:hypothetical protein
VWCQEVDLEVGAVSRRGEEKCETYSQRRSVVGGPEKVSLYWREKM